MFSTRPFIRVQLFCKVFQLSIGFRPCVWDAKEPRQREWEPDNKRKRQAIREVSKRAKKLKSFLIKNPPRITFVLLGWWENSLVFFLLGWTVLFYVEMQIFMWLTIAFWLKSELNCCSVSDSLFWVVFLHKYSKQPRVFKF